MAGLHPTGPALGVKNRRVLAERTGWPVGAVELCEWVEAEWPDWWEGLRVVRKIDARAALFFAKTPRRPGSRTSTGPRSRGARERQGGVDAPPRQMATLPHYGRGAHLVTRVVTPGVLGPRS